MTLRSRSQTVVIVQARMGSSRLPGKSLLPFGESTVLQHIVGRLRRMSSSVELLVATSTKPEDDAIEAVCERDGVSVSRGADDDVLGRFAHTIEMRAERPEIVVRVCADRPLFDPTLVDELLAAYDDAGRPDYFSNTLVKSYPEGLDVEIVRTDVLMTAATESVDPFEREHVTPFVYRRPERFSLVNHACPYGDHSSVRVTLDTQQDYDALLVVDRRLRAVMPEYDWRSVLTLAELEPRLFP